MKPTHNHAHVATWGSKSDKRQDQDQDQGHDRESHAEERRRSKSEIGINWGQVTGSGLNPRRSIKSPSLAAQTFPELYSLTTHSHNTRAAGPTSKSGGKLLGPVALPTISHPTVLRQRGLMKMASETVVKQRRLINLYENARRDALGKSRISVGSRQRLEVKRVARGAMSLFLVTSALIGGEACSKRRHACSSSWSRIRYQAYRCTERLLVPKNKPEPEPEPELELEPEPEPT